ncbi:aspartate-semialdehyde dehydrogenase [Cerasicoccus arenae]|uniref:Aspartate-semialdehyde dehydrogenase n=1 Tax=Cerasicoccus arenae TaxID=424488 RepID=A0A8J3D9T8_9BACT|nr:aspartate-semialdehyde dehydrogenase [Cerasicoccus arenae]MBK1857165.1 aspartate-semialdehyde dehydrogenase [Cerasicoccus arenae]GHB92735.1 aspartate-semialdehyde dehydrogenase [Cerasicoccus arenae]
MSYRVGIVGATGAVGQELIDLLHRRNFPMAELVLLASSRSAGKTITWQDKSWTVQEATPEAFDDLDIAIFSAGGSTSTDLCPEAAKRGCVAVDNSSAFRMDPTVPLVVPEINPAAARSHQGIIANPNCSTAVALMGLYPLHREFGLKRFTAATYQAVSGAGAAAMAELEDQLRAWAKGEPMTSSEFPYQIAFNLIPHVDVFYDDGYTKEEHKMLNESRKILGHPELRASTTCVRVPVLRAHSIAVNAEFERPVDLARAREVVSLFEGAELVDDTASKRYPMPLDFSGKEKCGVGRMRIDSALDNGLALWIVGDQLWKGAALNAVQIAELLVADKLVTPKTTV